MFLLLDLHIYKLTESSRSHSVTVDGTVVVELRQTPADDLKRARAATNYPRMVHVYG